MQATQAALQSPHREREGRAVRPVEVAADFAEVAKPTDLDAQAMEAGRARPSEGASVGRPNVPVAPHLLLVEELRQPDAAARDELDALSEALEEMGISLRAQIHPQQFPTGPGVIAKTRPQAPDRRSVAPRRSGQRGPLDELDHHIAVPDPTQEPGEALQSLVQGPDGLPVAAREQPFPDRQRMTEASHLAMELVETVGRRVRVGDDPVHRPGDIGQQAVEFGRERRRAGASANGCAGHGPPILPSRRPTISKPSVVPNARAHL